VSIGDALAEARSQAGLTITQVSQRTRIRETIIRGIERGDFSACGGDFYARGHIRSIAKIVGADAEELIREYDAAHGAPAAVRAADVFEPATPIKLKERRSPNWTLAMAVVLVILVGYGAYRAFGAATGGHSVAARGTPAAVASHSASSKPRAARSASPKPQAQTGVVVQLAAIEDCWVEFTSPAGQFITQAYVVGGDSKTWTFSQAVDMEIGNPGGIVLTVNGKKVGSPGTSGQPVTLSLGRSQPVTS
jgi:transcriptional regulator with XRE-family HTH domain